VVVEDYIIHNGFDCTVSDISTEKPGDFVPASVGHNPTSTRLAMGRAGGVPHVAAGGL